MLLLPVADEEEIDFIPSMPLIAFSSGSLIWASMMSELAPVYFVETLMVGGSIAGIEPHAQEIEAHGAEQHDDEAHHDGGYRAVE